MSKEIVLKEKDNIHIMDEDGNIIASVHRHSDGEKSGKIYLSLVAEKKEVEVVVY